MVTLTNRLTLYFLTALGLVLAAFSGTTYLLARTHLMRQSNDRATATLDTLVAAAEVEPDGLDWEPELRRLPLRWEGEPPVWAIYNETGSAVRRPPGRIASGRVNCDFRPTDTSGTRIG